jgi:hypothetical protein
LITIFAPHNRLSIQDEQVVLSGKRVERRESGAPGEFADLENMTAEQLADFIRKQAEESLH